MNVDKGCLFQMAFHNPMAASEDDSEAYVRKIYFVEVNKLVTDHPDRKPLLDRRKKPISEEAS
jgi:hypothetical protein